MESIDDYDQLEKLLKDFQASGEAGEEPGREEKIEEIKKDMLKDAPASLDVVDTKSVVDPDQATTSGTVSVLESSGGASCSVKGLLRENVKLKMALEGKSFQEDTQQEEHIPTEKEKEKETIRKERNKAAAKRSRDKKEHEKQVLLQSILTNEEKGNELMKGTQDAVKDLDITVKSLLDLHPRPHGYQDNQCVALCPAAKSLLEGVRSFIEKEGVLQESDGHSLDFPSSHSQASGFKNIAPAVKVNTSQALCPSSSSATGSAESSEAGAAFREYLRHLATSVSRGSKSFGSDIVNSAGTSDGMPLIQHGSCQNSLANAVVISNNNYEFNVYGNGFSFNNPCHNPPFAKNGSDFNPPPPPFAGYGDNDINQSLMVHMSENNVINQPLMIHGSEGNLLYQPPMTDGRENIFSHREPVPGGNEVNLNPWPLIPGKDSQLMTASCTNPSANASVQPQSLYNAVSSTRSVTPNSAGVVANLAMLTLRNKTKSVGNCKSVGDSNGITKYVGCNNWKSRGTASSTGIDYSRIGIRLVGNNTSSSVWDVEDNNTEIMEAGNGQDNYLLDLEPDPHSECKPPALKKPRLE